MNTVENRTVLLLGVSRPPTSGFHERPSRVRGYKHVVFFVKDIKYFPLRFETSNCSMDDVLV